MKDSTKGFLGLLLCTVFFSYLGVLARYLDTSFAGFQQVYLRIGLASILMGVFFWKYISFTKYSQLSRKEQLLLFLRGILNYSGVGLFTYGILHTTLLNASVVGLFPFTTLFAIILLGERLGFKKALGVGLSLFGIYLVGKESMNFGLGKGEIYALVGEALFGLAHILRRFHSNALSNRELAFGMLVSGTSALIFISFFVGEGVPDLQVFIQWKFFLIFLLTALLNICAIVLLNYGFSKLSGIVADRILAAEVAFAFLFGFIFYSEIPHKLEILGMLIILGSILWLQKVEYNEQKKQ